MAKVWCLNCSLFPGRLHPFGLEVLRFNDIHVGVMPELNNVAKKMMF